MTAWARGPSVRKLFVEPNMCKSRRWVETATALRNYSRAAMTSAIDGNSIPKTLKNASAGAPSSSVLVLLGRLMRNESPSLPGLYRCRSTGSAEHCGDPLPQFLASYGLQLGNVIFVPRSFRFGHTQRSL
jgi:hypothetical protein